MQCLLAQSISPEGMGARGTIKAKLHHKICQGSNLKHYLNYKLRVGSFCVQIYYIVEIVINIQSQWTWLTIVFWVSFRVEDNGVGDQA